MIEIQRIKERTNEVLEGIGKRNIDATKEIAQIIAWDCTGVRKNAASTARNRDEFYFQTNRYVIQH